jgi:hypothetical protein
VTSRSRHIDRQPNRQVRAASSVHHIDDVSLPRRVAHPRPDERISGIRARGMSEAAAVQRDIEHGSDLVEQSR